jgi:hypothetical protein
MGKVNEHPGLGFLTSFGEQSDKSQETRDATDAEAAQKKIELEERSVELRRQQGLISEQDAAKQIEALKNQAVLAKNIAEQKSLRDQISGKQSDLNEVNKLARQNTPETAFGKKQGADATVNDLTKQITDIPKAISQSQKLQKEAQDNASKFHLDPHESGRWRDIAGEEAARQAQLQGSLAAAKAALPAAVTQQTRANEGYSDATGYQKRAAELTGQVNALKGQLGTTVDRQKKMTPLELQQNHLDAISAMDPKKTLGFGLAGLAGGGIKEGSASAGTQFEKMGFAMNGSSKIANDQLATLKQIHAALLRQSGGGGGGTPAIPPGYGPVNSV